MANGLRPPSEFNIPRKTWPSGQGRVFESALRRQGVDDNLARQIAAAYSEIAGQQALDEEANYNAIEDAWPTSEEVTDIWVDEAGDTMTGDLIMSGAHVHALFGGKFYYSASATSDQTSAETTVVMNRRQNDTRYMNLKRAHISATDKTQYADVFLRFDYTGSLEGQPAIMINGGGLLVDTAGSTADIRFQSNKGIQIAEGTTMPTMQIMFGGVGLNGVTDPNGNVTANKGSIWSSRAIGAAKLWYKETGVGNTGWREIQLI